MSEHLQRARGRGPRRPPLWTTWPNLGTTWGRPRTRPDTPVTPDALCVGRRLPSVVMSTKTPRLLRPFEVSALLGVARQTVHDYESQGRLEAQRTPGGHRRYPADQPALAEALAAQDGAA